MEFGNRGSSARKNAKTSAAGKAKGVEVAVIEREDVAAVVTLGQNDERGIGESDVDVAVGLDHPSRLRDVADVERREVVRPASHVLEKQQLGFRPAEFLNQVVDLRQHEGRQNERRLRVAKRTRAGLVMTLVLEQRGENAARVEQDHSPKPPIKSPARSAIVGSPSFTPGSGTRGAGARRTGTAEAIASRITSASDRPWSCAADSIRSLSSSGR